MKRNKLETKKTPMPAKAEEMGMEKPYCSYLKIRGDM